MISSMAPASSELFTGRDDYLQKMFNFFGPANTNKMRKIALLFGLGGVGKTQICLKFLEDHEDL